MNTTGRYRQLIRCLQLRRVVAGRRHVDLKALAKSFAVHERTIRRDLVALREAGEPVHAGHERDIVAA